MLAMTMATAFGVAAAAREALGSRAAGAIAFILVISAAGFYFEHRQEHLPGRELLWRIGEVVAVLVVLVGAGLLLPRPWGVLAAMVLVFPPLHMRHRIDAAGA